MTDTLFTTQIVLAIAITIVVLLQKSSSIGLGAYSGSNDSVFGSKGPASFLTKATFTIGTLFILNTIALGYFYNKSANSSILDEVKSVVPAPKMTVEKNIVPKTPISTQDNKTQQEK
jgi:preprotein translocase subunit SecG